MGRRRKNRAKVSWPLEISFKENGQEFSTISGKVDSFHEEGFSCHLINALPKNVKYLYAQMEIGNQLYKCSGKVVWQNDCLVGIQLDRRRNHVPEDTKLPPNFGDELFPDRRLQERRRVISQTNLAKRSVGRRLSDFHARPDFQEPKDDAVKVKSFLRNKSTTFTEDVIRQRREWISDLTGTKFDHVAHFSETAENFRGKIENPIGVAQVPLGIVGPIKINGKFARGNFFIPMATTEGALITSYTWGSHLITRSGGVNVRVLKDELRTDPTFVFENSRKAQAFLDWLEINYLRIKQIAESTSRHLKLIKLTPLNNGRRIILNFHFTTGDAMGMNMTAKATDAACKFMRDVIKPEEFWLHSNVNAIKKATATNFLMGYGKSVIAEVTIPRKVIEMMNTTPESMERYFFRTLLGSAQAGGIGINAHFANAMTAIAIACGQDAALVANTQNGVITCEVTKSRDLYFSAYMPSVFAATVGGGTDFGTAAECLNMLGCRGADKSYRLAEIIGATVLAGEISLMTSIVNETYVHAHETFGRNRPQNSHKLPQ